MGQAYPELVRAEALITETLKLEETRFRKTLERGLSLLDEATKALKQRRQSHRRDRVHALRHLRLSARSDAGRAARRAASPSTSTASTPRWSASSAEGARLLGGLRRGRDRDRLVPAAREARRDRIPRLRDRERRRRRHRARPRRQGGRRAEGRRERRGRPQPDAVLRRVRRPGRRHRRDDGRRRPLRASPTRRRRPAICSSISARSSRARSRSATALALEVDHARRSAIRAQPFGDASAARGAAPGARRPRRAEGLAGRARPAALRLLASQADDAGRARAGRGHRQRLSCCRTRR